MFKGFSFISILSVFFLLSAVFLLSGCEQSATSTDSSINETFTATNTECQTCPELSNIAESLSSSELAPSFVTSIQDYLLRAQTNASSQVILPIEFHIRGFCTNPETLDIARIEESYISEFEGIASALQPCADNCKISINEAEYCALDTLLQGQSKEWPQMSEAFQNATILLQGAGQWQRSISSQSNVFLSGAISAASFGLNARFSDLTRNNSITEAKTEFSLATQELYELGSALQALAWAGLGNEEVKLIGDRLVKLSQEVEVIDAEIQLALTRAQVLEPLQRSQLAKRVIDALIELSFIERSLLTSAEAITPSVPNTSANANINLGPNITDLQAAIDCFTRLSLNTAIVPEFAIVVRDELQSCRSFSNCPISKSMDTPPLSNVIERMLKNQTKAEKLMLSIRKATCR